MRYTRTLLVIVRTALFIVAAALLMRVVVRYFGALSASSPGEMIVDATALLVPPFGIRSVRSLYGGVFDANAGIMMVLALLGEWFVGLLARDD